MLLVTRQELFTSRIWRVETKDTVALLSFLVAVDGMDAFAHLVRFDEDFANAVISEGVKIPRDGVQLRISSYEGSDGFKGAYADALESGKHISVYYFGCGL